VVFGEASRVWSGVSVRLPELVEMPIGATWAFRPGPWALEASGAVDVAAVAEALRVGVAVAELEVALVPWALSLALAAAVAPPTSAVALAAAVEEAVTAADALGELLELTAVLESHIIGCGPV
jgi:hypothetical protein